MGLKILVIPFSILMILVLIIGFIRPAVSLMQEKQVMYDTKIDQAKSMDTLLNNVNTLLSALDNESEATQFVQEYFPQEMDQGRVIDMLNFLASNSGVAVDMMKFEELKQDPIVISQEVDAAGAPVTDVSSRALVPKTFSAKVVVRGRYESIKNFLQRVAHMNRAHKTRDFSIKVPEKKGGSEESELGVLVGSFEADFDFLEPVKQQNALYSPTFQKNTFTMNPYATLSDWVTENIPLLERPASGRPNPFQ